MNKLFFGDNLDVLPHIQNQTVDLVYLDPPFNSNATYNVLFKARTGQPSEAQAEAFRDTWEWGETAAIAYENVIAASGDLALVLSGLRKWLGENNMMAYLAMMAVRLIELRRVLKETGSLFLHCDPVASHYLKLLLDGVFRSSNFQTEIIWKRTFAHGNVTRRLGDVTDTILYYTKTDNFKWNQPFKTLTPDEIEQKYPKRDADGRRWQSVTLRNPGVRPNLRFPYTASNGNTYQPHPNGWSCNLARLQLYDREGRLHFPASSGGALRLKMYADESRGERLQSLWDDIPPIGAQAQERLGYPTQKPRALLERIISMSSDVGDLVLDPFCGCGTTIEAAERLGRQWIGIDVTHYAITLIDSRLRGAEPKPAYSVEGRPTEIAGARELFRRDPHQFQWWAAWRLGAQSYREAKRGPDRGIDGNIFFPNGPYGTGRIIISVKGGENIGPQFVRELRGTIERESAEMGILIVLAEPTKAMIADAAAAGFVAKSAHGDRLPRLQIVTIEDMLDGRLPKLPPIPEPARSATPRHRQKQKRTSKQIELLLPFIGNDVPRSKGDYVDPRFLNLPRASDK